MIVLLISLSDLEREITHEMINGNNIELSDLFDDYFEAIQRF